MRMGLSDPQHSGMAVAQNYPLCILLRQGGAQNIPTKKLYREGNFNFPVITSAHRVH